MNFNGVVLEGAAAPPRASSVIRLPKQPQPPADETPTPASTVQVEAARDRATQRVRQKLDSLTAQRASQTRAGTRLRLDKATDRVIAQIVNQNIEVIRQIPPEEALRIAARFRDVVGLIFDQRI